jgi:hypothetical protein
MGFGAPSSGATHERCRKWAIEVLFAVRWPARSSAPVTGTASESRRRPAVGENPGSEFGQVSQLFAAHPELCTHRWEEMWVGTLPLVYVLSVTSSAYSSYGERQT